MSEEDGGDDDSDRGVDLPVPGMRCSDMIASSSSCPDSVATGGGRVSIIAIDYDADCRFDDQFFQPHLYELIEDQESPIILPYESDLMTGAGELMLPGPLSFVQHNAFYTIMAAVVAINITTDYLEFMVATGQETGIALSSLERMDMGCLAIYVLEITLRLMHFGTWYFFHHPDARWNFFDVAIVSSGVLDQLLLPLFKVNVHIGHTHLLWTYAYVCLRACRLLRIVKLFGMMLRSDFKWTESAWFQYTVSCVIILSIIIMGVETDIKSPLWAPIDTAILAFFLFELFVRLKAQAWGFFLSEGSLWNMLDFCIVFFGVFDQWVLCIWMSMVQGEQHSSELGDVFLLVRMMRLLRILRLLRLVKAVRPLYLLALGVVEAMQSMFWVLVLTFVTLYTVAVLMTRVVGHGAMLDDDAGVPTLTTRLFDNVWGSMFTLFVLMNGEEWRKVEPLLNRCPGMKVVFVVFTIFSSWALLSVMTGVVSDNMISAKKEQNQRDEMMHGERSGRIARMVDELFVAGDHEGKGALGVQRYQELLNMPFYMSKMQHAAPNASAKDLRDILVWLDADDQGEVRKAEVHWGFSTLTEPLSGKAMLCLDADIKHRFQGFHEQVRSVTADICETDARCHQKHKSNLALLSSVEQEDAAIRATRRSSL